MTIAGRTDKKFCSDSCRNTFNNRRYAEKSKAVRDVNRVLMRNRRILENLESVNRKSVSASWLLDLGFSFAHCTGFRLHKDGRPIVTCYDKAYFLNTTADEVEILREGKSGE